MKKLRWEPWDSTCPNCGGKKYGRVIYHGKMKHFQPKWEEFACPDCGAKGANVKQEDLEEYLASTKVS